MLLGIRHDLVGEHVRAENVFDKAFSVYRGEMSQLIKLTRYRLLEGSGGVDPSMTMFKKGPFVLSLCS